MTGVVAITILAKSISFIFYTLRMLLYDAHIQEEASCMRCLYGYIAKKKQQAIYVIIIIYVTLSDIGLMHCMCIQIATLLPKV